MDSKLNVLQRIEIATPCDASWDDMAGDERKRFCQQCELHVYNLAAMTEQEAVQLIEETQGRLCGRIYRRKDGTVLTQDCPMGLRAVRRKLAGFVGRIAAAVLFAGSAMGLYRQSVLEEPSNYSLAELEPFASIQRWLDPDPIPPPGMIPAPGMMTVRPIPNFQQTSGVLTPSDCEN